MMPQGESAKPIVGCVRLSAIGDVIMLGRSLEALHRTGHTPVLITRESPSEIARHFKNLHLLIIQTESGWKLLQRSTTPQDEPWQEQSQESLQNQLHKINVILDFQNTSRSIRALAELRVLGLRPKRRFKAKKFRLERSLLLLKTRFNSQRLVDHQKIQEPLTATSHRVLKSHQEMVHLYWRDSNEFDHSKVDFLAPLNDDSLIERIDQKQSSLSDMNGNPLPEVPDVVLFPGSSLPLKGWPLENCILFSQYLLKQGRTVVMLGGSSEISFAQSLIKQCPGVQAAVGHLSLAQSAGILQRARVVVTTDSFPGHLRDLENKPTFVLFGATSPALGFAPLSNNIRTLSLNLPCSPCTRHGRGLCRFGNQACMANIDGEDIARRVIETLNDSIPEQIIE